MVLKIKIIPGEQALAAQSIRMLGKRPDSKSIGRTMIIEEASG